MSYSDEGRGLLALFKLELSIYRHTLRSDLLALVVSSDFRLTNTI